MSQMNQEGSATAAEETPITMATDCRTANSDEEDFETTVVKVEINVGGYIFAVERKYLQSSLSILSNKAPGDLLRDELCRRLSNIPPARFNKYLNWLVHRKLPIKGHPRGEYRILADLYLDGVLLDDDRFRDAVISAVIAHFNEKLRLGNADLPSLDLMAHVYNTQVSDYIKRLYAELWARGATEEMAQALKSGVSIFILRDLLAAFVRQRPAGSAEFTELEAEPFLVAKVREERRAKRQKLSSD